MATRKNLRRRNNFRIKGKSTRGGTKGTKGNTRADKKTVQKGTYKEDKGNIDNYDNTLQRLDEIIIKSQLRQNLIYKKALEGLLEIDKIKIDDFKKLTADIDISDSKKQKSFKQIQEIIKNLNIEDLEDLYMLGILRYDVIKLFRFTYNKHKREDNPFDTEEIDEKLNFLDELP